VPGQARHHQAPPGLFEKLLRMMVEEDLKKLSAEVHLANPVSDERYFK
jgi:hypothetical protein